MKNNYLGHKKKENGLIILCLFLVMGLKGQITQTLNFSGTVQTFVVPPCVTSITVEAYGAQGASQNPGGTGGLGGYAKGVIVVATGQVLNIYVGGQNGYNGGGLGGINGNATSGGPTSGNAGNGGGASDVRIGGTALANRVIVGAGGGGAAHNGVWTSCQTAGPAGNGGAGGGFSGGTGTTGASGACNCTNGGGNGGGGGTGTGGGVTGTYNNIGCLQTWGPGSAGALGTGGAGSLVYYNGTGGGGGGGGGYYGGGSGANGSDTTPGGGGGGGSSFTGVATNTIVSSGVQSGDGLVILTYNFNGAGVNSGASSLSICAGSSATLSSSNVLSYTWTPGGSNASSIIVSPAVSTTYTVQGTNSLGCISNAVLTVTVDPGLPMLSVVTSTNSVCANKPVTITASGATTYTWTGNITNGVTFGPTATSGYTVTGANACGTATAAISVTVNPLPNITASINSPTVCNGSSITLNGGGSATGYTWSAGAPNNIAFAPIATTNYTVTGGSVNGCTASAVTGVTVLVTPTITPVVTPTAICFGGTSTLSAVGATGYTWTPGNNLTAATVTVSPPASTTFTLFRTNGSCSSTSTVNLVVNPLPLLNASGTPSQICAGTGVNLLVFGAITYTWLPGGFTTANFTVYPNFSTNYSVTGSNGNCTTTVAVPITVNPSPVISILSSTTTICQGDSVTLTASGGQTYTWQPSNTSGNSVVVSPNTTSIITVFGTNSFNCTSSQSQLILVNPVPNMSLTCNLPFICAGQTAILSVTNPTTNVVYGWSNGSFGTSIQASPVISTNYFATGTNTVTGCQNTNSVSLAVYISTFSIINPTAICRGETATLSVNGSATSYSWSVNGGIIAPSVTVAPLVNTTYYVTGINGSCQTIQSILVTVSSIPNVTALTAKTQICRFEVSTITGSGATSYSWNTGATTPTISFNLSLTTTYTLTGTDLNGCAKTITVTQFVATCIGIENFGSMTDIGLNVYPNPNNGNFVISSDVEITVNIINTLGQLVNTISLREDNKKNVTVNSLPNGIYFITGESNGLKVNRKIVVER